MQKQIQTYLAQIEEKHQVKILYACETGSRAWGFPSPDSDYDIRMIYVHPEPWYFSLQEKKDSIDVMLEDNLIDISGWELKKALKLLWKSNAPMLERIQSPIIYHVEPAFIEKINALAPGYYSKIATMHHYLSMSQKILAEISGREEYKLKKLFYALRTSIACKWIMEREEIPPIEFFTMLQKLDLPIGLNKALLSSPGSKNNRMRLTFIQVKA